MGVNSLLRLLNQIKIHCRWFHYRINHKILTINTVYNIKVSLMIKEKRKCTRFNEELELEIIKYRNIEIIDSILDKLKIVITTCTMCISFQFSGIWFLTNLKLFCNI